MKRNIGSMIKSLKDDIMKLVPQVSDIAQCTQLNNLKINGAPLTQGENCPRVVQATGETLSCLNVATDVDAVHSVPANDGT